MSLQYDRNLFQKWRKIAITEKEQLQLGASYWCTTGESFTLMAFETMAQYRDRLGLPRGEAQGHVAISTSGRFYVLPDFNIGGSYSPWLIFANRADCEACMIHLRVTIDDVPQS